MIEIPLLRKQEKQQLKNKPYRAAKKPNKMLILDSIEEIQAKTNQQATEKILKQIKARAERAQ